MRRAGVRGPTDCALGYVCNDDKLCQASFNVASARSTSNTTVEVTFDGPPDPAAATTLANYTISGLTLVGHADAVRAARSR